MNGIDELCGKKIRSPLGIPSGVVGTKASIIELLANRIFSLGFFVTKSTNSSGKNGNAADIYTQYRVSRESNAFHSAINAVGLDNRGAAELAGDLSKIVIPKGVVIIASIFGATPEEFLMAARPSVPFVHGFELNISCSHSEKFGLMVGQDIELVLRTIDAVLCLDKDVFIKVSPRMDMKAITERTRKTGIKGYSAVNSFGPVPFEIDGQPVLTNKVGSYSGMALTEIALKCIRTIRENTDLIIIGGGGLSTGEDLRRAKDAGANFFTVGTAITGMNTDTLAEYFPALLGDFRQGTHNAEKILEDVGEIVVPSMVYRKFTVVENEHLAPDLFVLRFDQALCEGDSQGQFAFIRIPEIGARPFSALTTDPFSALISDRGVCTHFLSQLKPGDSVYVRGPHGKVPKVSGKIMLVGGGAGVAALALFAEKYGKQTVAVLGAKNRAHLYDAPFRHHCRWVYPFTENDGHEKSRGLVTDDLSKIFYIEKPEVVLMCGPRPMAEAAVKIARKFLPEEQILVSLEFHTDCGVGLCGKDATPKGFRPCVDGTFMTPTQLGL